MPEVSIYFQPLQTIIVSWPYDSCSTSFESYQMNGLSSLSISTVDSGVGYYTNINKVRIDAFRGSQLSRKWTHEHLWDRHSLKGKISDDNSHSGHWQRWISTPCAYMGPLFLLQVAFHNLCCLTAPGVVEIFFIFPPSSNVMGEDVA